MRIRLPKKRRFRIYIYCACMLLVLWAVDLIWIRIWRHVSIGYDTTRITAPLKADGIPDYLAYIDQAASAGVTPENNAAVPLLQVVSLTNAGDAAWWARALSAFYARLGISAPGPGEHYVTFDAYLSANGSFPGLEQARTRPWISSEHPEVAAWVDVNLKYLECISQMAERTSFYCPLIAGPDRTVLYAAAPARSPFRQLFWLSEAQAMRLAGEGKIDEAHALLLACHHAARLVASSRDLLTYIVATTCDSEALQADANLCNLPGITGEQLKRFAADAAGLAPFASAAGCIDGSRYMVLEDIQYAARDPEKVRRRLQALIESRYSDDPWWKMVAAEGALGVVPGHFNAALRNVNVYMDQWEAAARAGTVMEREDLAAETMRAWNTHARRYDSGILSDPAMRYMVEDDLPYPGGAIRYADIHAVRADLARVELALAAYKLERGAFPETLAALAPAFIPTIPQDSFVEKPLHYSKTAAGFVLYSVGFNRKDDGGRPRDPMERDDSGDDIVFSWPG